MPWFNHVLCSIKESKDLDAPIIDELQSSLLVYEQQRKPYAVENSRRSNHICGKRDILVDLDESFRTKVILGNNSSLNVIEKGSVQMLVNSIAHILTSLFFSPGLRNNLLSIGQLAKKGLEILVQIQWQERYMIKDTELDIKGLCTDHGVSSHRLSSLFFYCKATDNSLHFLVEWCSRAKELNDHDMGKNCQKHFWPKAVSWALHILNKSPTLAMKNKAPEEAWSGFKPLVAYFKVFVCVCHVHIPDYKRTMLDDRSIRCIFLGVSEESEAYRLYDTISERIILSRDVVFEEDNSWNWETNAITGANGAKTDEYNNEEQEENGSSNGNSTSLSEEPCDRRTQPTWMRDYLSEEESHSSNVGLKFHTLQLDPISIIKEEDTSNYVMFTANDPTCFEAQKDEKWRAVMHAEIEAIEKNYTLELTELQQRRLI
ncbi:hypothetical protein CR513_56595, partial [Mucuna pruriens]